MKRRRHTPEQIVRKLREAERLQAEGADIATVARHLEISEQTFHRWRNQYGGMRADDAKKLKELEKENSRLKHIVADQALDIVGLEGGGGRETGEPGTPPPSGCDAHGSSCDLRASCVSGHRTAPNHPAPGHPGATGRRTGPSNETQGAGPGPSPLWLSPNDRSPAGRRILRQPQADPAPVPGRGPPGDQEGQEALPGRRLDGAGDQVAGRPPRPRLGPRLRLRPDHRSQDPEDPGHHRRVHQGGPGPRGGPFDHCRPHRLRPRSHRGEGPVGDRSTCGWTTAPN